MKCLLWSKHRREIMCRRLLEAVSVFLVISRFIEAEAAAVKPSEYHPLADGNSETYSVDGAQC